MYADTELLASLHFCINPLVRRLFAAFSYIHLTEIKALFSFPLPVRSE